MLMKYQLHKIIPTCIFRFIFHLFFAFSLPLRLQVAKEIIIKSLTGAPMGYSRTMPANGGGGAFRTPALLSAKLLGRFSFRKRHLIAPGLNFPNMLQNFICDVNDDVTGRVKDKILDCL